ncbi:MAG TPA: hypothetical protein VGF23_01945 [Gaiellaceae bacterium]
MNLREGRSVSVLYETRFFIEWPEHLGGESSYLDVAGSMVLRPSLGA